MPLVPTSVRLNSVDYRVQAGNQETYVESTEPAVVQQADIAGTSRPSKNARPDILSWRIDNWSQGESEDFKFWNSSDNHPSQRGYYRSSGPVEVAIPGQATLGFATAVSLDIGAVTGGPFLVALTNPWVFYTSSAKELVSGVWTSRTTGTTDTIDGQPVTLGGFVFVAYTTTPQVRRINASSNATFTTGDGNESPWVTDSKLFVIRDDGTDIKLYRTSAMSGTLPLALTLIYTASGANQSGTGADGGIVGLGPDIYFLASTTTDPPRVHLWDAGDEAGRERMLCPPGFRTKASAQSCITNQNDVIFIGGWTLGTSGEPNLPTLLFLMQDRWGVAGKIRPGTSDQITNLFPDHRNGILIGTSGGKIYRYDMAAGGIYEFAQGVTDEVKSMTFSDGVYYFATVTGTPTGKVHATTATGTGKYVSSSTIQSPIWDFDYPEQPKLLLDCEVHTTTLPSGASVEIQLVLDDGTTITTDSAGATMAHTSGARTKFTLSTTGTSRTCRFLRVDAILKTSNTANTPTLYSVTVRALAKSLVTFFDVSLAIESDSAGNRRRGAQLSGWKQADNLRTLRNTDPQVIVDFIPYFSSGDDRQYAQPAVTTHKVVVEDVQLSLPTKGQGTARVRLKKVG